MTKTRGSKPLPKSVFFRTVRAAFVGAAVFTGATGAFFVTSVHAENASWSQWRGPNRDGHAAPQKLLKSWPEEGPKLKWTFKQAGTGYSASSVDNGKLFTMGSRDGKTFLICIDAKNGKLVWEKSFDVASQDGDYLHGWGGGPRSTPTVVGDVVYVLSDLGTIACLKVADGSSVWSVNLVKDFGGSIPKWGYSESPLVDGDRVIVTPGNKNFMVGLDVKTGKKIWGSEDVDIPAHYVSVIKADFQGQPIYVTASQPGLIGIDAKSGKKLFGNGATGNGTAVIPTPVVAGDMIYHVSAYGAGNALVKLSKDGSQIKAEELYHKTAKSMENHHGGVVLLDGTIYGFSKADGGVWMAQDLKSGDVLWSEKVGRNASGSIALADGLLYCYNDKDGTCLLVEPSRDGFKSKGKLTIPEQTSINRQKGAIWAHPIVADGMLVIRDQDLIYAYDVSAN